MTEVVDETQVNTEEQIEQIEDNESEYIQVKKDDVAIIIGSDLELTMHLPAVEGTDIMPSHMGLAMALTMRVAKDASWVDELMVWFTEFVSKLDAKEDELFTKPETPFDEERTLTPEQISKFFPKKDDNIVKGDSIPLSLDEEDLEDIKKWNDEHEDELHITTIKD